MIKNYFNIALRQIWRNKTFSLINIIGLSVSMSLGLLIILIIKEQYSFDRFHVDADRIYRINTAALRTDGGSENYASAPLPLATAIEQDYSFAEDVVRINSQVNGDAVFENVTVPIHGFFTGPSFLKIFNFKLEKGDINTALSSPESLILTQEAAKKIFGNADAFGKTVKIKGYGDFIVSGILEEIPDNTHFDFEVLTSTTALPVLEKQKVVFASLQNWMNYYSGYVYFKLKKGKTESEVNTALAAISKKNYADAKFETRDKGYEFYLQPLLKISPGPELSNQLGKALPELVSIFLLVLATIIIIMAGLNYTNLLIAKSLKRAREIGVRKVMGASRWQVFLQFIGESVIFSLAALVCSYFVLQLLKSSFLKLHITKEFAIDLKEDMGVYFLFLLFSVAIGILAGLLPAAYLSAFKPVLVLKNIIGSKVNSKFSLRKVLIVVQFTLSLMFVVCVLFIYQQVQYMLSVNYGINDKNILNIRLQGNDFEKLSNEINNISGVKRMGAVSHSLGTFSDWSSDYKRHKTDEPFVMRDFRADNNYLTNIEVQFLAGRNFQPVLSKETETEVILNETALKSFGFNDAPSAINQTVFADDSVQLQVVGVVKDFNFRPLNYAIGPLAFRYRPADFSILSIAIEPSAQERIMATIEPIWKQIDPVHPIQYKMMADELQEAYTTSGFLDVLKILTYITFLAITLACLGLLGMVMYSTQLKVKEIGVRKVLGASVKDITVLLTKSFALLIGISVLIGVPLGYIFGNLFLQNFAYRITNTVWLVVLAVIITGIVGLATICSQTIKAAMANPVKSLRTE